MPYMKLLLMAKGADIFHHSKPLVDEENANTFALSGRYFHNHIDFP